MLRIEECSGCYFWVDEHRRCRIYRGFYEEIEGCEDRVEGLPIPPQLRKAMAVSWMRRYVEVLEIIKMEENVYIKEGNRFMKDTGINGLYEYDEAAFQELHKLLRARSEIRERFDGVLSTLKKIR